MSIATTYDGLLFGSWVFACMLCIPAELALVARWRFKGRLWVATILLGAMSVIGGFMLWFVCGPGLPLMPIFLGALACLVSRPRNS